MKLRPDYRLMPYPKYRRWMVAAYRWAAGHKHMIHGLFEVDVTEARATLRQYKLATGEPLSFTAFLVACLAKAVDEHKEVQAFRQGTSRLLLFDDVDVYTVIEHDLAGEKYIIPYIVRAANHKTVLEIHQEIRAAQASDVKDDLKGFWPSLVPDMLFRLCLWGFSWIGQAYPRLWKNTVGTVGISAVGMFGKGAGWGIPQGAPTTLSLTVGGIGEKQTIVDGNVAAREYLSLTISVDHDIVDGAPATRFTARLAELIESGCGLSEAIAAIRQTCENPA